MYVDTYMGVRVCACVRVIFIYELYIPFWISLVTQA